MGEINRKRYGYLDFLRILAAFLVIVNHTNSLVFKALVPSNITWWFSIVWYYLSKIAVPLFIMVSGACLLPKVDSYRKAVGRFLRVLMVLVLFSYGYYLAAVGQAGWSWHTAFNIPAFLQAIWEKRITDSFWYLYFYLGLMVMLPMLQRLAGAMKKRDIEYFMAISFGVFGIWPIVTHYVPALALPEYFDVSIFGVLIGLFFAGHYLHTYTGRIGKGLCAFILATSLAASTALTALEYGRISIGEKYWFMDDRSAPSIFIILSAMAVMLLAKRVFEDRKALKSSAVQHWTTLGGCAFGIYLIQDFVIAQTRYRFFVPLSGAINPFLAALIWEIIVFGVALAAAWIFKRIPGLRKLL
ncbi:MAG: acyltransferase family protein [Eubacteriales bacterium]|nr:acyltransferase family protein [Eubacteriales bacterium]